MTDPTVTSRLTTSARPLYVHRSSDDEAAVERRLIMGGGADDKGDGVAPKLCDLLWYCALPLRGEGVEGRPLSRSIEGGVKELDGLSNRGSSASLLLLVLLSGGLAMGMAEGCWLLAPPMPLPLHAPMLLQSHSHEFPVVSVEASHIKTSEKRRNSRGRGGSLRSTCSSTPRLRRALPGAIS